MVERTTERGEEGLWLNVRRSGGGGRGSVVERAAVGGGEGLWLNVRRSGGGRGSVVERAAVGGRGFVVEPAVVGGRVSVVERAVGRGAWCTERGLRVYGSTGQRLDVSGLNING